MHALYVMHVFTFYSQPELITKSKQTTSKFGLICNQAGSFFRKRIKETLQSDASVMLDSFSLRRLYFLCSNICLHQIHYYTFPAFIYTRVNAYFYIPRNQISFMENVSAVNSPSLSDISRRDRQ